MSRTTDGLIQNASGEEWLGFYKIYNCGHSRTLTVPVEAGIELETVLCMRLGWCDGRIEYLKAVARDTRGPSVTSSPFEASGRTASDSDTVYEKDYKLREVRGDPDEKMMTIPADYDETVFETQSHAAILAGNTSEGARYLRIVPEEVWGETFPQLL